MASFVKGFAIGLVLLAVLVWAVQTTVSVDRPSSPTTVHQHHPDESHKTWVEGGLTVESWNTPPEGRR